MRVERDGDDGETFRVRIVKWEELESGGEEKRNNDIRIGYKRLEKRDYRTNHDRNECHLHQQARKWSLTKREWQFVECKTQMGEKSQGTSERWCDMTWRWKEEAAEPLPTAETRRSFGRSPPIILYIQHFRWLIISGRFSPHRWFFIIFTRYWHVLTTFTPLQKFHFPHPQLLPQARRQGKKICSWFFRGVFLHTIYLPKKASSSSHILSLFLFVSLLFYFYCL
jgi:hypothetical protein